MQIRVITHLKEENVSSLGLTLYGMWVPFIFNFEFIQKSYFQNLFFQQMKNYLIIYKK